MMTRLQQLLGVRPSASFWDTSLDAASVHEEPARVSPTFGFRVDVGTDLAAGALPRSMTCLAALTALAAALISLFLSSWIAHCSGQCIWLVWD